MFGLITCAWLKANNEELIATTSNLLLIDFIPSDLLRNRS